MEYGIALHLVAGQVELVVVQKPWRQQEEEEALERNSRLLVHTTATSGCLSTSLR